MLAFANRMVTFARLKDDFTEIIGLNTEEGGLNMKKITALALVMVLCASLLVGCGCSGNVSMTTEPTSAPTTAPTTEPSTAPTTEATTQPTSKPTTAPDTSPTDSTGDMNGNGGNGMNGGDNGMNGDNGMGGMNGTDGNTDTNPGNVPDDSTHGARGRRIR